MEWLAVSPLRQTTRAMLWDGTDFAREEIRDTFVKGIRRVFVDRQGGAFVQAIDTVNTSGGLEVQVDWTDASQNPQVNTISIPPGSYYVVGYSLWGETLTAEQLVAKYRIDGISSTEH